MSAYRVLDATAGGKHMWHAEMKDADNVIFTDRRAVPPGELEEQPGWNVLPDVIADTRQLPFKADTFDLIAYDPPHRVTDGGMQQLTGIIEKKYGALRAETWQDDLRRSFDELHRVLSDAGTLTFKWADIHKSHDQVIEAISRTPMYGVTTEKERAITKWWVFQNGIGVE